jgi:addiction module RelE/StbE family toxin
MRVDFTKSFSKQYRKMPMKIQAQCTDRLRLFITDQKNPLLKVHSLMGDYRGCWSINITGDIRAVYKIQTKDIALFIALGSHSELYE